MVRATGCEPVDGSSILFGHPNLTRAWRNSSVIGFPPRWCGCKSRGPLHASRCYLGKHLFCKQARRFDSDGRLHSLVAQRQSGRLLTGVCGFDSCPRSHASIHGWDPTLRTLAGRFDSFWRCFLATARGTRSEIPNLG